MFKLPLPVTLESLRKGKDGTFYADFVFVGGAVGVPVDAAIAERLKPMQGQSLNATFKVRARAQVVFDRSVTMFEAVALLDFNKQA